MITSDYPSFIQERLEKMKHKGGTDVVSDQKYTYVLLALGERRTGGYEIKVLDATEQQVNQKKQLLIKAKEIKPDPDAMVIQMITYPVAVYRLPKTNLPVKVQWVRQ